MKSCKLCGGNALEKLFDVNRYDLDRCRQCEFVQVFDVPRPEDIRAIYGPAYFDKGKYRDDIANRSEQSRRIALLARHGVRPGMCVLDFGCAGGDFILRARDHWETWGVDLSAAAIESALAAMPDMKGRLFAGFPSDEVMGDGMFDAITMWDVIEHLPDPLAVVRMLVRKLKPSGVLTISTPHIGAPIAKIMGRRWHFMTPPEHLGFFSVKSAETLLRQAGLSELSMTAHGKMVNFGFLVYKLGRVFPALGRSGFPDALRRTFLGRMCLYVPTQDILYICARR